MRSRDANQMKGRPRRADGPLSGWMQRPSGGGSIF